MSALRQAELEANKKLHDKGQEYTTLLGKVVLLRAQVVELQEEVATNKAKMANLEQRFVDREVHLGKVEAELTEKAEAFEKAKEELIAQAEDFEKARQNSSIMPPTPMLLGLKMPLLRLLASILRWTFPPLRR